MASEEDIGFLRALINESGDIKYTDPILSTRIDSAGTPEAAAYRIWVEKAASYAEVTSFSEGGSSRQLSDLHKNALAMAKHFSSYVKSEDVALVPGPTITRPITRA